jgi:origin recognition complex subunit 5
MTRLLLIAAYLASYTPARTDTLLFMKSNAPLRARKRKKSHAAALSAPAPRPGTVRHRKIARKLLGPQGFAAERMLAIFWALVHNNDGGIALGVAGLAPGAADTAMAVATLASLRLVVRTSPAADVLDASTKWKVNIGWDVVRSVARSVGVEVEEYFWAD